jgi:hypothetical protein
MANLTVVGKTEAVAFAFQKAIGTRPVVTYPAGKNYGEIKFTFDQKKLLQKLLDKNMSEKGQSDIHIDLLPVVAPVLLRKIAPYAIGLLAIGFLTGKLS